MTNFVYMALLSPADWSDESELEDSPASKAAFKDFFKRFKHQEKVQPATEMHTLVSFSTSR